MKSLVPWMYVALGLASQPLFAVDDFHAYRLGHYKKAAAPLLAKTGSNAIADYYLARMYLYGYGELRNPNVAMRYFANAATKGYLPAVLTMAKYSLFKENNPELAVRWFKQAAAAGDVSAQMFMAAAAMFGVGMKAHEDSAIKYYIDAAKNGNAIAQFTLAEHFINSKQAGNNKLGLIWLTKSAANGNPKAQTKLATLHLAGKLLNKDIPLAVDLLNKAATHGDINAMLMLGDVALVHGDEQLALRWYQKVADLKNTDAYLHIATVYLQEKSALYNPQTAYLWTLKAAQSNAIGAKTALSNLYAKGLGVPANAELAKQWAELANIDNKKITPMPAMEQAALWLSNGTTHEFSKLPYQMSGIFTTWQNPAALKDNIYNQAPQMDLIHRGDIFKSQFGLIQPNDIPISAYYQTLVNKTDLLDATHWTFPGYPLNSEVAAVQSTNSPMIHSEIPKAPTPNSLATLMEKLSKATQEHNPSKAMFNALYFRAVLGDAQSQFEIGQLFEKGIGVKKDLSSAAIFYQNAAAQEHLAAEYSLGILYLEHAKDAKGYAAALHWLTDAAFKGNNHAQYVLSRVLDQGKKDAQGNYLVKPNREQALSMLYLAAAQGYGLAEYDLGAKLAQQTDNTLSVDVKKQKIAVIRELFRGASNKGVVQALVPLAFYNADDQDKKNQAKAFAVAAAQAQAGDKQAALLLGMLYDRGIGVTADHGKAIQWYKLAKENPVSQFILGTYIAQGKGLTKDREQGLAQLRQSADKSFAYAYFNLAALEQESGREFLPSLSKAYTLGNGQAGIVLADYYLAVNNELEKIVQAQQIYTGLAEKGDAWAQLKLAYLYEKGLGGKRDLALAQKWYTLSAEQGNPTAQFLLGKMFQVGENSEPDYNSARTWYLKSAPQLPKASIALGFIAETVYDNYGYAFKAYEQASAKGDPRGMYNLALMYLYGKGMPVDAQKAKVLLKEASNKGIQEATNQLANLSFNGIGQQRNVAAAAALYTKAAKAGNANALYQLGLMAESGYGATRDMHKALASYQKAADKGNSRAMLALARLHRDGPAGQDAQSAAALYQQLANKHHAYAQYQLATLYLEGTMGQVSPDKGKQLLHQAAANGYVQATHALQRLAAQSQAQSSYIEPFRINRDLHLGGKGPEALYYQAMHSWSRGDEWESQRILNRLQRLYPKFVVYGRK